MNKRKIFLVITAFILTSLVAGSLGAVTVLAWPFSDVHSSDWFYGDVAWLDTNGITHGCTASQYCPNNNVLRSEMAAFLHREAGALVAYGLHITRDGSNNPVIEDWFCNVCGYFMIMPSISGSNGDYDIDVQFTVTDRYVMCAVDTNYVDTRDAFCTVSTPGGSIVRVRIYDVSAGGQAPAEFWVMVYGQ
jgi:hypothetical protein